MKCIYRISRNPVTNQKRSAVVVRVLLIGDTWQICLMGLHPTIKRKKINLEK